MCQAKANGKVEEISPQGTLEYRLFFCSSFQESTEQKVSLVLIGSDGASRCSHRKAGTKKFSEEIKKLRKSFYCLTEGEAALILLSLGV